MASKAAGADTLDQLQTPEQVKLLDAIDSLRQQGLGHYGISLPQLIVCGDQSSGKSSLLEGLTRLRFPSKEGVCTTFATEVVLRKQTDVEITCTIIPGKGRSPTEKAELIKFNRKVTSREDFSFPSILDEAKERMMFGAKYDRGSFFQDILRISYAGPDLPSFTIVDLPGIIETQLEGGSGAQRVLDLLTDYIRDEKSIIMAVVPASYDPELQKIFTYLKQFDASGSRTLGIITKPDALPPGCDTEKEMIRLARNERFPVGHGWHAVKNRGFETKDHTDDERDESERKFFASGVWASLPAKDVGIGSLRTKLSRILLEHIGRELPSLVDAIQESISFSQSALKGLGPARENSKQQREYLTRHAERFQALTYNALRGVYADAFFHIADPNQQAPRRLRTRLQNLNIDFADVMYRKGHTWNVKYEFFSNERTYADIPQYASATRVYDAYFDEPHVIRRSDFLRDHVGHYVQQSRSSGLPSIVNPWVIGEIFRQQSQRWRDIAERHLKEVFEVMKEYIEDTCSDLMDSRTCYMLTLTYIEPELERRWERAEAKLHEFLVPYMELDPMIYDPGFLQEIEIIRKDRYANGQTAGGNGMNHTIRNAPSGNLLTESLDDFTNLEILDLMETYYKRAMAIFINNIAVLAIENCLVKDLTSLFSASLVAEMGEEKLNSIASESEEIKTERGNLKQRLEVLEEGKKILKGHICNFKTAKPARGQRNPTHAARTPPKPREDHTRTPPHSSQAERFDTPTIQLTGTTANLSPIETRENLAETKTRANRRLSRHNRSRSTTPTKESKNREPSQLRTGLSNFDFNAHYPDSTLDYNVAQPEEIEL